MIEIIKMGENGKHNSDFLVDRPLGHTAYLLLLVKSKARFWYDEEWHDTQKDIAIIFKPGQKHLYGATNNGNEDAYINDWMHIADTQVILPEKFPFGQPVMLHNPDEYYSLFHLINSEFYGNMPHKYDVINSLSEVLLRKICDESNVTEFPDIYYELVKLRKSIYSSPEKEWSVSKMAERVNISSGYLHLMYKHFFNITCIEDVIRSRVQRAGELLLSTNASVEEIGYMCGYNNTEHFIRQFKKINNITPAKYRKYSTISICELD